MEIVKDISDLENIKNNKIIGNIKLNNASVEFKGENNILYLEDMIELENCKIRFTGSNSLIYLDSNPHSFSINIRVGNDSVFYLGRQCYLNRRSNMYATERKNIIIGSNCLLSFDSYFRTADPHLIYDCNSKKRLNESKSILIGDHVWIGQGCLILKGTTIGSGAIIGGNSVVSNKNISSNSLYAGNPAKKIKESVFYKDAYSTHDFNEEDEENSKYFDSDLYTYKKEKYTLSLSKIDKDLMDLTSAEDKLFYLKKLSLYQYKNRFYME